MLRWNRDKDKSARPGVEDPASKSLSRSQARSVRPVAEPQAPPESTAPATLESVLLSEGTVTAEELKAAQEVQAKEGGFLGQILITLGYIDANSLTSFLAKHCKIPHLSLLDYLIDEEQIKLVPQEICLRYRLLPIDRLGKNLTVAMVNPLDTQALDEVRKACPELRVKPILCEYSHFQAVAGRLFKQEQPAREMSMSSLGLRVRDGDVVSEPASAPSPKTAQPSPAAPPPPRKASAASEARHRTPEELVADLEPLRSQAAPTPPPPPVQEPSAPPPPAPPEATHVAQESTTAGEPEPSFDDEAVLEAFFGMESHAGAGQRSTGAEPNSVLQEMVAIMGDSMRDTYGMLARKLELFHGLTSEQVAKIFAKGITAEYDEGQTVFKQGDSGDDVFVILGGAVAMTENGRELGRLTAGDAFGEMALMSRQPRATTARVLETSSFLVLNEKTIRRVLDKDTALQLLANLVVNLSRRLRDAGTSKASS